MLRCSQNLGGFWVVHVGVEYEADAVYIQVALVRHLMEEGALVAPSARAVDEVLTYLAIRTACPGACVHLDEGVTDCALGSEGLRDTCVLP